MKPGSKGRRILPVFFSALVLMALPVSGIRASVPPPREGDQKSPKIRVLLENSALKVRVSGLNLSVQSPRRGVQFQGEATWSLRCETGKIRLTVGGGRDRREFRLPEPVSFTASEGSLFWENRKVRETLRVYTSSSGKSCQVINELDLEDYLVGVVNGEFSSRWHDESVAAQVVAARTYAWHQLRNSKRHLSHFDVEATTRDQVYAGAQSEDARARQVVERTRGQILVELGTARGPKALLRPIKAFYHSTCGGMTDSPEKVFGEVQPGVRGGVACPYCSSSPRFRWSLRLSALELQKALGFPVDHIRVLDRWDSGRAKTVEIRTHQAGLSRKIRKPASEIRAILGAERLRSTAFDVQRVGESEFVFDGRGNGHGVGMCQWGAKEMGERGQTFPTILSHYYPASRIVRVW
jgi:stage II sporulation protein D